MDTFKVFLFAVEVALSVYGAAVLAAQITGRAKVIWRLFSATGDPK